MFDIIYKCGPTLYLVIDIIINLLGMYFYQSFSVAYEDAVDELFAFFISIFLILIPLIIFMFAVIRRRENLKQGLFATLWIWVLAYMMLCSAVKADRPCGAG